jgi:methyl-accepting chemotaxis protein
MEHVVTVADQAGGVSRDVLAGAGEIGREAENLRTEVDQFLAAVRDDTTDERRRYERQDVSGVMVGVQSKGHPTSRVALRNVSRGGAALACDWTLAPGTAVEVEIPEAGGPVPARAVRCERGELAVVFSSEPGVLARIDRALAALPRGRLAA